MWNELASPFRVSVISGFVGWGYLARFVVPWLLFVLIGLSPIPTLGADPSTLFLDGLITVFVVGLATVPLVGALALLLMPIDDGKRGIVAFLTTIFSFFPLLLLGFDALAWILQQWQLAIFTLVWIPIVWMMTRMLRRKNIQSA